MELRREIQLKKLTKWFAKFKRYTITYKKGAYYLFNLFNSPQTMIDSFAHTPFGNLDTKKKRLTTNTIFIRSDMYYCIPEEHLWIMVSNLYFKKNVMMENLYDSDLPIEYHFVNIHIKEKSAVSKSLVNGLTLTDRTWSVFKAGHAITEYHFRESNEKNITIYFTNTWLERQKQEREIFKNSRMIDFFDSSNTYMILEDDDEIYDLWYEKLMDLSSKNADGKFTQQIKELGFEVLLKFIEKSNKEILALEHFNLNDKDRKNIQKAEQYLKDHLVGEFPGIDATARRIGISATKLKKDFKSVHSVSIYKYYSARQMQLAKQLLTIRKLPVKEVALMLGYKNISKFSAVFKKHFEVPPSEISKGN